MKSLCVRLSVLVLSLVMQLSSFAGTVMPSTDNFDDGILNPAWQVVVQTESIVCNESNGKLNVGGTSGLTGELVMRYNRELADVGLVKIDYNWITYSGHKARVGLGLFDLSLCSFESNLERNGVWLKGVGPVRNIVSVTNGTVACPARTYDEGAIYYGIYNVP